MPVQLEVFLQFSFSCFCYIIHVVSFVQEKRSFKFLSKHLVLLLYGNQHRNQCFVHKTTYFVVDEESRGLLGNCLFLHARGWGIDHQVRAKLQIPGGMPGGGGMVTGRIEPCISLEGLTDGFVPSGNSICN